MDANGRAASPASADEEAKPVAPLNGARVVEDARVNEEKLLRLYMEVTGCDEREARSTYMLVQPAGDDTHHA